MSGCTSYSYRRTSSMSSAKPSETVPGTAPPLLAWYDRHARDLPWRVSPDDRAHGVVADPYRVWLSEIMLQQTTVQAVKPYFAVFREPLADRSGPGGSRNGRRDEGLGRARILLPRAQSETLRRSWWSGTMTAGFPIPRKACVTLPGIGPYTAAAIAAIAFDRPAAVVDGNIERVFTRLFEIETPLPSAKREIRDLVVGRDTGRPARRLCPGADGSRRDDLHAAASGLRTVPAHRRVRGARNPAGRSSSRSSFRRKPNRFGLAPPSWPNAATALCCWSNARTRACWAA
jgi:hypothetical protein